VKPILYLRISSVLFCFVTILRLLPAPAEAAGFQQVMVPDAAGAPIEAGIWYPSDAPTSPQPLELFHQTVAVDGSLAGLHHPLIVISHGTGGSFAGHYDTALALADAGFVVVALTHTGDNWRDRSGVLNIMDRPRQVSRVLDYMLADWPDHAGIDPARIGMFGFSAGGFTTLVAVGGRPDFSLIGPHCAEHPQEYTCALITERPARTAPPAPGSSSGTLHDTRIKAAVVAAPALGFTFAPEGLADVRVPVQLWRADDDQMLPAPWYADAVRQVLPAAPDFQTVPGAGHFDFLVPCSDALAAVAKIICTSEPGFDRADFHRRLNSSVVTFFSETLKAP
jgi:predicted dienelactone hydrolase